MEPALERYVDPAGWSLAYPPGMHVIRSAVVDPAPMTDVTVASFAPAGDARSLHDLRAPVDAHGRFPPGAVALRLTRLHGHPLTTASLDAPESTFPLGLGTFAARDGADEAPRTLARTIDVNGERYSALAWIAPDAGPAARAVLEEIVTSLAFPLPASGTVLGSGFTVLSAREDYPSGSFTEARAGDRPLYVVHAPGGFYALGWRRSGPSFYRDTCSHQVDRERLEIYCAECGARWDRIGRVITRPPDANRDDWLHLSIAKVAWNGHVLVHPRTYQRPSEPNARHFWPGWTSA